MTINVGKLKEILAQLNDDDLVVLAKDGEGNGFSPLNDYSVDIYIATSTWSGERHPRTARTRIFTDKKQDCITLWPVN